MDFLNENFIAQLTHTCPEHTLENEYSINSDGKALIVLPCGCEYYIYKKGVIK